MNYYLIWLFLTKIFKILTYYYFLLKFLQVYILLENYTLLFLTNIFIEQIMIWFHFLTIFMKLFFKIIINMYIIKNIIKQSDMLLLIITSYYFSHNIIYSMSLFHAYYYFYHIIINFHISLFLVKNIQIYVIIGFRLMFS